MFPQAPNWYPVGIPSESLLTTFTPMEPCNPMGNPTCHLLESLLRPLLLLLVFLLLLPLLLLLLWPKGIPKGFL